MKIFVSAAEISSDIHAERIVSGLIAEYKKNNITVEVAGIGGPRLRSIPGFQCIEQSESMRVMGLTEVVSRLPQLWKVLKKSVRFIRDFQPDLVMTFDYPDFHFKLIQQVKKVAPNALRVCGIPPKVWVWRSHRVEKIRNLYHGVWVIFPFEKEFYEKHRIPVIYEGNPLLQDFVLAPDHIDEEKTKEHIELAVMPGSRDAELRRHLPLISEALIQLSQKTQKKILAWVPVPNGLPLAPLQEGLLNHPAVEYRFVEGGTQEILNRCSVGLIKSGTSTLEAVAAGCLPVIFYKVSPLSEFLFRTFVRYSGPVGLPNILLGVKDRDQNVFPELIGREASVQSLTDALSRILESSEVRSQLQLRAQEVRTRLIPTTPVAVRVAARLSSWLDRRPLLFPSPKNHGIRAMAFYFASVCWSSVNWLRRRLVLLGLKKSVRVEVPSILVGNLQAGGSGKTPIVIELAKDAVRRGMRVAVLSRAYGAKKLVSRVVLPNEPVIAAQVGDEPCEIREAVPEVILGLGAERNQVLSRLPKVDLVIFDDGFQNLSFQPSLVILAVTERGPRDVIYRDFFCESRFADFLLHKDAIEYDYSALLSCVDLKRSVWLACGVGSPEEVAANLIQAGIPIDRVIPFSDHHAFTRDEVKNLMEAAGAANATLWMTSKDEVKIRGTGVDLEESVVVTRSMVSKDWLNEVFVRLHCLFPSDKLD